MLLYFEIIYIYYKIIILFNKKILKMKLIILCYILIISFALFVKVKILNNNIVEFNHYYHF